MTTDIGLTAADIMAHPPRTVSMEAPLSHVKSVFDHEPFHHLLVVEDGVLRGVVSDRDLLKALSPYLGTLSETARDLATLHRMAHQIMSHHPVALGPEATLQELYEVFAAHHFSCVPIVDEEQHPVGIVGWRDLLRGWSQQSAGAPSSPA